MRFPTVSRAKRCGLLPPAAPTLTAALTIAELQRLATGERLLEHVAEHLRVPPAQLSLRIAQQRVTPSMALSSTACGGSPPDHHASWVLVLASRKRPLPGGGICTSRSRSPAGDPGTTETVCVGHRPLASDRMLVVR